MCDNAQWAMRVSQLWEHLCSLPGASNSHPTPGHKLIRSYLDFWLNSSTFWCKNHFCSLKTEGVIKYFLTKNIFPMTPCLVKALLHCALCTGPWQWQGTGSVSRWSCRQCGGTILPWPPRLSPPLLWLVSNAGPAPVLAPVLHWPPCCRTLQVL